MVKDFGVNLAVDMVRRLSVECGIRGFHFCTMNLEKSIQRVLEALHWSSLLRHVHNKLIAVSPKSMSRIWLCKNLDPGDTRTNHPPRFVGFASRHDPNYRHGFSDSLASYSSR
jgi:hypothetical protein